MGTLPEPSCVLQTRAKALDFELWDGGVHLTIMVTPLLYISTRSTFYIPLHPTSGLFGLGRAVREILVTGAAGSAPYPYDTQPLSRPQTQPLVSTRYHSLRLGHERTPVCRGGVGRAGRVCGGGECMREGGDANAYRSR